MRKLMLLVALALAVPCAGSAQGSTRAADSVRVLAIADSALAAINRGDMVAFTDWMVDEATITTIAERAGARHRVRTKVAERARASRDTIVERGFDARVLLSGPMATVWLPYDLYVNGNWSHCGVDVFTFVRTEGKWMIASLAYTIEQPPACAKHPAGPPRGARGV